ncbi:MAG: 30S ribosomal protein S6 [Deltaproteobacteria bacterium]|nr:30S ribosomal protein S6 [Deltaproteobacteria bacterium]
MSAPSMNHLREYETIYILRPEVTDETAVAFIQKMRGVVEKEGGKHLKITNMGRRKLAWERQKQQKGMFVHHRYLGKPGLVAEYERNLAIEETVMLRQSVVLNKLAEPAAYAAEEDIVNPPIVKEKDERKDRRFDDDGDDRYFDRDDRDDRGYDRDDVE